MCSRQNRQVGDHKSAQDIEDLVRELASPDQEYDDRRAYDRAMVQARRKYHMQPSKAQMTAVYRKLIADGQIERNETYEFWSLKKQVRSASGVLVITIFTSEYFETSESGKGSDGNGGSEAIDLNDQATRKVTKRFDCAYDCYYCPDEPGQPRSYLSTEPGVMRANECHYDVTAQFDSRLGSLVTIGHHPDKLEVLVLGGTWSSYPIDYRENYFIRDIYYAANTWAERRLIKVQDGDPTSIRPKKSLVEERALNEYLTGNRIIGVTLETRPDCINWAELRHFRRCGCTRVQIGVQHTDDEILRKINRRCYRRHTVRAIRMLKETGFKVDIHLMPDLPGSDPEKDWQMFQEVLSDPDLQADQLKIYPTAVTRWTTIEKWYREGSYKPYAEIGRVNPTSGEVTDVGYLLVDLLIRVKKAVHPWIRLNRVIRDIPERSILGGNRKTHLRDVLLKKMKKEGVSCRCIRCREVRDRQGPTRGFGSAGAGAAGSFEEHVKLFVRTYRASQGTEYYLSFESPDEKVLYGQLRLRINDQPEKNKFVELRNCALIRELHVYGQLVPVGEKQHTGRAQHWGLGQRLLRKAEEITRAQGLSKMAVISGDGVKGYYRRWGFVDDGDYLVKHLPPGWSIWSQISFSLVLIALVIYLINWYFY